MRPAHSALKSEASAYPLESVIGIQIEFESFPDIALAVESLANETHKIELINVIHRKDTTFATIFVPEGKLSAFEKKLRDYLSEKKNKNGGAIDNRPLIDAIRSFRVAALEALWTDDPISFPMIPNRAFGGRFGFQFVEIGRVLFMTSLC